MAGEKGGRAFWTTTVAELEHSGLRVAVFARSRGLNAASLYAWRRRLRVTDKQPGRFLEVSTTTAPATSTAVRISLGALVLELDALPPAAWVAELLGRC